MDKKLTDAEIKKALECCTSSKGTCKDCPAFVKVDRSNCKKYFRGAIDLINRLQSENERLKKEYNEATNAYASAKGKLFRYWMLYGEIDSPLKELEGEDKDGGC